MGKQKDICDPLSLIFAGIEGLRTAFKERRFTIDGRLVGDIGEVLAAIDYDIVLDEIQQERHDGITPNGRKVQIKATFKDSLTFRTVPDYYLGLKLNVDGTYKEIFNGPGSLIYNSYSHRKGIGSTLLSFPNDELEILSNTVPFNERIAKRDKSR
jgi:hypothetical protein